MAYSMRSFKRSTRGRRRSMSTRRSRRSTRARPRIPRYALAGYSRNVEKKYFDKAMSGNTVETETGATGSSWIYNGMMYASATWSTYSFGSGSGSGVPASNDLLKGLGTGTTARTRIGNKIKVNFIKGAMTFTAAAVRTDLPGAPATANWNQGGEVGVSDTGLNSSFLRTTFRWCIVKDLQVNSTNVQIGWNDVFENGLQTGSAGVHSELNVDNMGRFVVLQDQYFTIDADTPQKTVPFKLSGGHSGSVIYNGPSDTSLTNKGIYIIYAAFSVGSDEPLALALPNMKMHSRVCFSDE